MNCPICTKPVSKGYILCEVCHGQTPGRKPSARNAEIYKALLNTTYGDGTADNLALYYHVTVKRIYQINQQVKDFIEKVSKKPIPKKQPKTQVSGFFISDEQAARLDNLIPAQAPNRTTIIRAGFKLLLKNGGAIDQYLLTTENGPFPQAISKLLVEQNIADGINKIKSETGMPYSTLARIAVELGIQQMKG